MVSPSIESYSPVVVDLQVSDKERSEIQATMPCPWVLGASSFPRIVFRPIHAGGVTRPENSLQVKLTGKLGLHDVEQEITFPVRVSLQGERLRAVGTVSVAQSDFNIAPVKLCGKTVRVKDQAIVKFDFLTERANR